MDRWTYSPSPLLLKTARERLSTFPRDPDLAVYGLRWFGVVFLRTLLGVYFRMRVVGRSHIPARGPFVLVANHSSHLDAVALSCALPRGQWNHAYAAAAQDYFFRSFLGALTAVVFANALPFDRKDDPERSLELCADLLHVSREGLLMFPEGTRSSDGAIGRFRPGVGRLVAGTEVPVVPAYLDGAHEAWPRGSRVPRPRRVTVVVGEPRFYRDASDTRESHIAIADDLREAVEDLRSRFQRSRTLSQSSSRNTPSRSILVT